MGFTFLAWVGAVMPQRPYWQRAGSGACTCPHALCLPSILSPPPPGISRGPSPVVLGSQDALPVATVFTEYVHAYFRGHSPRYAVRRRVDSEGQTGLPGLCVWVLEGQPPGVCRDPLCHGGALPIELSHQAPLLKGSGSDRGCWDRARHYCCHRAEDLL